MGVVLYHVWAGNRDEFTGDYAEACRIFAQMFTENEDTGNDVHLHVEEYASEEDYEADRLRDEKCIMTTAHGDQLETA